MPKSELGKARAIAKKGWRCWDYEHTAMIKRCLIERGLIVIRRLPQFNPKELQPEHGGGAPSCFPLVCGQLVPGHGRGHPIRKPILDHQNPPRGPVCSLEAKNANST